MPTVGLLRLQIFLNRPPAPFLPIPRVPVARPGRARDSPIRVA